LAAAVVVLRRLELLEVPAAEAELPYSALFFSYPLSTNAWPFQAKDSLLTARSTHHQQCGGGEQGQGRLQIGPRALNRAPGFSQNLPGRDVFRFAVRI
jgi:hypothetical protein